MSSEDKTQSIPADNLQNIVSYDNFEENSQEKGVDLSLGSVKKYCISRFTDLIPTREYMNHNRHLLNPIPAFKAVSGKQWLFIGCGFAAWTWDAFDFFTVNLNIHTLSLDFGKSTSDITWAVTLVLMLRSVGAFFFGFLGDKYGNKWPFVANLIAMMIIQIGISFVKTFKQFLAVRALFGIVMGGVYGNATALSLDDCPIEARGIVSGLLQQGYAFGYLLAVIFTRAIADNTSHQWRACYWFAAGVTFLITVSRIILPQTESFVRKRLEEDLQRQAGIVPISFGQKAKGALKGYWLMMIYMVLLMAGFNFMSHGSQDLFPTYLTNQLGFGTNRSTVTNCVANLGALSGGIVIGHISNFAGRRLCIMLCCILGGALIYPWAFVHTNAINASVFFLQFAVQGAFGAVPAHLTELAHPDFKSFIVGLSYQLGNLASSASSTIESTIGARFPLTNEKGDIIYNYGKVMAILMGAVFGYVLLVTFIGPERREFNDDQYDENSLQKVITETKRDSMHKDDSV